MLVKPGPPARPGPARSGLGLPGASRDCPIIADKSDLMEERRSANWIGGSIIVKGDVVSTEDLVIDGQVHGTIELGDHSLTIGEPARR